MTVAELIEKLRELPNDAVVYVQDGLPPAPNFGPVEDVWLMDANRVWLSAG